MTDKKKPYSNHEPIEDEGFTREGFTSEGVDEGPGESAEAGPDTVSASEYEALAQELQQVQAKAQSNLEGWQRERADFANYKRRIERDQQLMTQNITADVIKKFLGVVDDLERALKARPESGGLERSGPESGGPGKGETEAWANGIELILRKLQTILEKEGVQRIPAEMEPFDPARHEAISYEASPDHKTGEIIEVMQQGYTIGDRVIRPAMVRVAR